MIAGVMTPGEALIPMIAETLRGGGRTRTTVSGMSMSPLLLHGDLLEIAPERRPRIGDILLVVHNGSLVVHRLVRLEHGKMYTRGDATGACEELTGDQVLGKVVAGWRNGRPIAVYGLLPGSYWRFYRWARLFRARFK